MDAAERGRRRVAAGIGLGLHMLARLALRVQRPLAALRTIGRTACLFPPLADAGAAVRLADDLDGHGTCLSRAMTVAACLPESVVVIGVGAGDGAPLFAHAWVEHRGRPLRQTDVAGGEIVRLPAVRRERRAKGNDDGSRLA